MQHDFPPGYRQIELTARVLIHPEKPRQVGEGGVIWALHGTIWVFSLLKTIIELSEIL